MSDGTQPGGRQAALSMVNGPAIGLIVTGVVGGLLSIIGLFSGGINDQILEFYEKAGIMKGEELEQMRKMFDGMAALNIVSVVVNLAVSVLILVGGLRLKDLSSRGLAMSAAIVAMVPCFSPCCCIGLPVGIWALMAMNKAEVKAAFDQATTS